MYDGKIEIKACFDRLSWDGKAPARWRLNLSGIPAWLAKDFLKEVRAAGSEVHLMSNGGTLDGPQYIGFMADPWNKKGEASVQSDSQGGPTPARQPGEPDGCCV